MNKLCPRRAVPPLPFPHVISTGDRTCPRPGARPHPPATPPASVHTVTAATGCGRAASAPPATTRRPPTPRTQAPHRQNVRGNEKIDLAETERPLGEVITFGLDRRGWALFRRCPQVKWALPTLSGDDRSGSGGLARAVWLAVPAGVGFGDGEAEFLQFGDELAQAAVVVEPFGRSRRVVVGQDAGGGLAVGQRQVDSDLRRGCRGLGSLPAAAARCARFRGLLDRPELAFSSAAACRRSLKALPRLKGQGLTAAPSVSGAPTGGRMGGRPCGGFPVILGGRVADPIHRPSCSRGSASARGGCGSRTCGR